MNLTALRRPHEFGRTTSQFVPATRSRDDFASARTTPGPARLVARWTTRADGRPVLAWALESERPAPHLIIRKRGSDV